MDISRNPERARISLTGVERMSVTLELLKEEVMSYMKEKGMDSWYASHMMELIEIGWERAEAKCMNSD